MMGDLTDSAPLAGIPKSLLDDLNKRFPPKCADLEWPDRMIWFYAGQRAVIDFLNAAYARQVESRFDNVLPKKPD